MFQTQQKKLISSLRLPVYFLFIIWAIQCFQWLLQQDLGLYGILPRQVDGLKGVVLAPLIHADFAHLISNSIPLFVLSVIILFFYRKVAIPSFIMLYLLTGLAVWAFARGNTYHIGASGVVYGLVSFVFWMGIFRRSVKAIILALIVTVLYSGMFLGVLPNQEGISWESHLLGGLVGIFAAYWFKDDLESDDEKPTYSWENESKSLEQPFFLNRDVFERKKSERENKGYSDWFSNHS